MGLKRPRWKAEGEEFGWFGERRGGFVEKRLVSAS